MTSISDHMPMPAEMQRTIEEFERGFAVAFYYDLEPAQNRTAALAQRVSTLTPQQSYDGNLLTRMVSETRTTSRDIATLRDLFSGRDRLVIWNAMNLLKRTRVPDTETIKNEQIQDAKEYLEDDFAKQLYTVAVGVDFVDTYTLQLNALEQSNTAILQKLAPLLSADKELDDLHALRAKAQQDIKKVELEIWKLDREKAELIRQTKAKFPNENNPVHHAGIDAMKPTFATYTKRREAFMATRASLLDQVKEISAKIKAHEDYRDGKTTVAPVAASVAANSNTAGASANTATTTASSSAN